MEMGRSQTINPTKWFTMDKLLISFEPNLKWRALTAFDHKSWDQRTKCWRTHLFSLFYSVLYLGYDVLVPRGCHCSWDVQVHLPMPLAFHSLGFFSILNVYTSCTLRFYLFWNGDKTSLLIWTQSTRDLYKGSNKEVIVKGVLEGSRGTLEYLNTP